MNEMMVKCLFEFIGTAILVLFGDGVVASNVLKKSKGENGGWVVVTLAWGLAVMLGVFISGPYSGAHLNPAVTLGLAAAGTFSWSLVVPYIVAQMLGGFFGAVLVYLFYKDHYDATDDPAAKLATFCTAPAIRNYGRNLFSEILGTFVLVFVILALSIGENTPEVGMGALGAFPWRCSSLRWACRSAERRVMQSTRPVTWLPAWRMPCCRSRARVRTTGPTRGYPSWARSSAVSSPLRSTV